VEEGHLKWEGKNGGLGAMPTVGFRDKASGGPEGFAARS